MNDNTDEQAASPPHSIGATTDTIADRFEAAWLAGEEPRIEDYLRSEPSDQDSDASRQLLLKLVMIDLEHRWRRATKQAEEATPGATEETLDVTARPSTVAGPRLEDYVRRFPALGSMEELPTDVIAFEYRARHLWGDRPSHKHYLARFPNQSDQLPTVLTDADDQLSHDMADSPSAQHLAKIQRQLGRYKLLEPLGRGGMGTVYKALHTKLDCHVAVKVMRADLNDEPDAVARFQREMKAVGGLSHPNLVRALDADQISGTHVLVMEYVDGIDIATLLKRTGPLPIADACELIRQTAVGLHHAHEHGLVHRDIKPSNLMLSSASGGRQPTDHATHQPADAGRSPEAAVKVLDLGLAHLQHASPDDDDLTRTGQLMGTIDYIAPEQTIDPRNVDRRADIYALGCTLYQLLCGRAPFSGSHYDTVGKKLVAHTQHKPPPIQQRRSEVFDELAELVDRMLAKRPDERIATAAEVAEALAPFAAGHNLSAQSAPSASAVDRPAATEEVGDETDLFLPAAHGDTHTAAPTSTDATTSNRIAWVIAAVSLLLLVGLGLAAWQIIIRITDREVVVEAPDNDREIVVKTPDGDTMRVGRDGKVQIEMAKRPPISRMALVTNPAAIEGVRSWTIETRGHRGDVHTVRYSPDGKLMATGCEDGTIRVWDPETGELDKALVGHDGAVHDLSWAADSQQIASGAADDTVRVWDVPSGRETQETEVDNPSGHALFVSFSPDGKTLAYGGADETIHLWDIEADDTRMLQGPKEGVQSVTWAGDGNTLVAANGNKTLTVWDVPSGESKATLEGHTSAITDAVVSPDDRTVASTAASQDEEESVRIWDMATGKPRQALPAHQHGAECIVFSPDGKLLIAGGAEGDGRLRVWNIDTGQLVYEQEPHDGTRSIASVAVSPDGKLLAIAHHDGTVALCNLRTGESVRALPKAEPSVAVSAEGHLGESPDADGDFVYVVHDDSGQGTLPPDQFSERYAWKNDPQQAANVGQAVPDGKGEVAQAVPDEKDAAPDRQAQPDLQEPEGPIKETMSTTVEGDLDREIAEWVLSVGGSVTTQESFPTKIENRDDLPSKAFQLHSVHLDGYTELNEAGLRRLAQLADTRICNLYLNETNVTDGDLEYLDGLPLHGLQLEGTHITDAGLQHLKNVPNLRTLYVDSPAITDIGLRHIEKLGRFRQPVGHKILGLSHTKVTKKGVESLLTHVPGLISLYLDGTELASDHDSLSMLQRMRPDIRISCGAALGTGRGQVYWILWLGGNLEAVVEDGEPIQVNNVEAIPTELFQITSINFNENQFLNDACAERFTVIEGLKQLSLQSTGLTDAAVDDLKSLTNLEELNLTGTKITAEGIEAIKTALPKCKVVWEEEIPTTVEGDLDREIAEWVLSVGGSVVTHESRLTMIENRDDLPSKAFQLFTVSLGGYTELDEAGLRRLAQLADTRIYILDLSETNVTDGDLEYLDGLPLNNLYLNGTKITDVGLEHLLNINLPKLRTLSLNSTAITDVGLEHLRNLPNLTDLSLNSTAITDVGLEHLRTHPNLYSLNLESTAITDVGLKHLEELRTSVKLDLFDTKVTKEGVESLLKEAPIVLIYLPGAGWGLDHNSLSMLQQVRPECHIVGSRFGRGAADWVLWLNGNFEAVVENGEPIEINEAEAVPAEPFQVTSINFNDNQFLNDACAKRFKDIEGLKRLSLRNTGLSDAAVDDLKSLTDLEEVDLMGTKITADGIETIREALPKCRVVWEDE